MSDVTKPDRDLTKVHPLLQLRLLSFFQECGRRKVSVFITEGYRSGERQDWLYARGRTRDTSRPVLTYAKAGQSYHNLLIMDQPCSAAVDVAVWDEDTPWSKSLEWSGSAKEWEKVHAAAEAAGLQTLNFEKPHIQLPYALDDLRAGAHWIDLGPMTPLLRPRDPEA